MDRHAERRQHRVGKLLDRGGQGLRSRGRGEPGQHGDDRGGGHRQPRRQQGQRGDQAIDPGPT
jgi:hypothetical protein